MGYRENFCKYTQVFAYGEDSRALRLESKLFDLRRANVNWIPLRYAHGAQCKS